MTDVFVRKEREIWTKRCRGYTQEEEDGGKDQSNEAINQGRPGATRSWTRKGRLSP